MFYPFRAFWNNCPTDVKNVRFCSVFSLFICALNRSDKYTHLSSYVFAQYLFTKNHKLDSSVSLFPGEPFPRWSSSVGDPTSPPLQLSSRRLGPHLACCDRFPGEFPQRDASSSAEPTRPPFMQLSSKRFAQRLFFPGEPPDRNCSSSDEPTSPPLTQLSSRRLAHRRLFPGEPPDRNCSSSDEPTRPPLTQLSSRRFAHRLFFPGEPPAKNCSSSDEPTRPPFTQLSSRRFAHLLVALPYAKATRPRRTSTNFILMIASAICLVTYTTKSSAESGFPAACLQLFKGRFIFVFTIDCERGLSDYR